MPLSVRWPWKCASCTIRIAEWAPPLISSPRRRKYSSQETSSIQAGLFGSGRSIRNTKSSDYGQRNRVSSAVIAQRSKKAESEKYELFKTLVLEQYRRVRDIYLRFDPLAGRKLSPEGQRRCDAYGIQNVRHFEVKLARFRRCILDCVDHAYEGDTSCESNELFFRLRNAFITGDVVALREQIEYRFLNYVMESRFPQTATATEENTENQMQLADLRYPVEWYPATRALQRTIHLHVGPTNSGKTYHALKRLEAAKTGIYAGPLRLLAHEVYTRLNAKGKLCALVTGEERRVPENMVDHMSSCTVEMVPLNTKVEVAVIDEIQMLGDVDRGWAWTQAFLGVQATEVHLCGELRTIELVTTLCAAMGDKLVIHKYERLGPLKMMNQSIRGDLSNLEKGDALILFSRVAIHAMKKKIEEHTGRRCATIYGSLPPETRAQQANFFNDPDNDYDFLVASDAVGMGLNLSIKRIIFETTGKFNGREFRQIEVPEIKQIAGRAGRYKTAHDAVKQGSVDIANSQPANSQSPASPNVGWITTLLQEHHKIVSTAMKTEVKPLQSAGVFPPSHIMQRFASYFPQGTPFSYIILRLHDLASVGNLFHLCALGEALQIADAIQPFNLSVNDRLVFIQAPVVLREPGFAQVIAELASCVAEQRNGHLLSLKSLNLSLLDKDQESRSGGSRNAQYLRDIEMLHKAVTLYLWLSYRFSGVFISQALAFHVKGLIEEKINECLASITWDEDVVKTRNRNARREAQKQKKILEMRSKEAALEEHDTNESPFLVQQRIESHKSLVIEADFLKPSDNEAQEVCVGGPQSSA